MKNLKLFFAALALVLSTSTFATNPVATETNRGSITFEIQKMLKDSQLIIEEEFTVKVIFRVTEDRKIEIRAVRSQNDEVNEFLQKRLHNQKLHGAGWDTHKVYELPVKVQSRR